MKRVTIGIVAMLVALGATSQPARDLPPTYMVSRASGAITIDGALDDAAWASAPWTADFIDIVGTSKPPPSLRTRAKLLWDENHLYVAAEMVETDVAATVRQRDEQLFREQAFEVFLDPGADGRDYVELQVNPLNTVCDLSLDKPYGEKGKANVTFNLDGLRSAVKVQGTVNNPSDVDQGWTVELAIPWSAVKGFWGDAVVPPHDDDRWRANLARPRNASDGGKVRRDFWVWSAQGSVNMHLPDRWGWLKFAAEKRAAAPATP